MEGSEIVAEGPRCSLRSRKVSVRVEFVTSPLKFIFRNL